MRQSAKTTDTNEQNTTNNGASAQLSIEDGLEQIEQILEKMESGDTGLEETFRLYEQGLKLIRDTEAGIDKVEKQIRILSGEDQGN